MIPIKSLAAVTLIAGFAVSQGQMPLPAFSSTYSSSSGTRGFWIQAPVDFEITGLRVPDEKKSGTQNVCVYVLPSVKSGGSQTATPVFFKAGVNSANVIPCSIKVPKGQACVILGCGGDATQQHNSYGAGGFKSNVLGNPVTLTRVYTNTNMITQSGAGSFYTYAKTSTSSIGRVEVFIKGQPPLPPVATATNFGSSSANKGVALPYLPLDDYSRTYSISSQVRGFHFQAPVDFVVTGFNVPNEQKVQSQVVAFYVFGSNPGSSITPTAADLKFFTSTPASSNTVLKPAVPIPVKKGDYVAVLGACYDGTTYHNSYSASSMNMQVLGQPFTAQRLTTGNLLTSNGLGSLGFASSGNCARVEVHVSGQTKFPKFIAPDMTTTSLPVTGTTAKLDVIANIPNTQGGLILGSSARLPAPVKTPFGNLLVSPALWGTFGVPNMGTGEVGLPIPNNAGLYGAKVQFQAFVWDLNTSTFGMSNGVEWVVGGRGQ